MCVFWNQSLIVSSISVLCTILCPRRLSNHFIRPSLQSSTETCSGSPPTNFQCLDRCQGCRCHRCHHSIGNRLCCVVLAQFSSFACQIFVQLGNISQPRSLFFLNKLDPDDSSYEISVPHFQDGCSHLRKVLVLTHHIEVFDICGDEPVIRSKHEFLDSLMELFN